MKRTLVVAISALAIALGACSPEITCTESTNCGGALLSNEDKDLNGDGIVDAVWVTTDACENNLHTPIEQNTLTDQPPHLLGEAPPEATSDDWCQNLVFDVTTGRIKTLNTWFPYLPIEKHPYIAPGQEQWYNFALTLHGDHFSFAGRLAGRQRLELSRFCLERHGISISTCQAFGQQVLEAWREEVPVRNIQCFDSKEAGGCYCDYDMVLNTGPSGTYVTSEKEGLLTAFDGMNGLPMQANYCVEGNQLGLSGYHRTALFRRRGIRSMTLEKVVCDDGQMGPGEEGVDCGPYIEAGCLPCPINCDDGLLGPGEEGADCGAQCSNCQICGQDKAGCPAFDCHDGIQNHGETGIDCGGTCGACP